MVDIPNHPISGKPDTNVPATSSEYDELPSSLGERQARSYRYDSAYHRGTAIAVVGSDGAALGSGAEVILEDVLYELRALRVAMMIQGTAADLHDGVENTIL